MARILVCDRCATQKDVHALQCSAGDADLCGKCAIEMLADFATLNDSAAFLREILEKLPRTCAPSQQATAAAPAPPMTDEARAENMRKQLAAQHGAEIYYVKIPELPAKPPCRVVYSGSPIDVLAEAPPNKLGNYFAKKVG